MPELDKKATSVFAGKVVRKDLVRKVKVGANVPVFVLEYLLGKYCATDDPVAIDAGLKVVNNTLSSNFVRPDEANKAQSMLKDKGKHTFIDKVQVRYISDDDKHWAELKNFGHKYVHIPEHFLREYDRLLMGGIWAQLDIRHQYDEDQKGKRSPFWIDSLKPIQLATFDLEEYRACRSQFTTDEWIDLLLRTIGLEPSHFNRRQKLHYLVRLIPLAEANYNLVELGPRETGKSYGYQELSPYTILLTGPTTVANLFFDLASGKIGLVGIWDAIGFDEVADLQKMPKEVVTTLKTYCESGTFARGKDAVSGMASIALNHPEIQLQVQVYGWLYQQSVRQPPVALQVHSGTDDVVVIPDDGGKAALEALSRIVALRQLGAEPYEPVGWSKCSGCGYFDHCWKAAEARDDVALVMDVDQGLARALDGIGVRTPRQLLNTFTADKLGDFKRPWGKREQRVGKGADRILQLAEVAVTKQERVLAKVGIPDDPNFVMFDLEGMPPYLDESDKIYLWGMQVFGAKPTQYMAAAADFGENGDRKGWLEFLWLCGKLFDTYADIRFVHWASYEKTAISKYIDRYGDPDGIAAKVKDSLLDLYTVAKDCLLLPLPSFSLKVVEKYIGFKRSQTEYGGNWSMAKFIEATETADEAKRQQVMDEILLYNREDLEATWAVFQWMRQKTPARSGTNG